MMLNIGNSISWYSVYISDVFNCSSANVNVIFETQES